MNLHVTRSLSIGLSSMLLLIGCNGDDLSTASATATDTDSDSDTDSTTTAGSATMTDSGTATTTAGGGSMSDSEGTTDGETETTTMGTTAGDGICGDGIVDDDEECDEGEANGTAESTCNDDCSFKDPVCGNGVVEVGEECDDGEKNGTEESDCEANCTFKPVAGECGDGVVDEGEECDDGNDIPEDGCENDCTLTPPGVCGNGILEWDELCDDGNLENGDGCEDDCTPTPLPACQAPDEYISCDENLNKGDAMAPYQALGLACSDKVNESILISGTSFNSINPNAWQIAKGFGSYIDPDTNELLYSAREGESFLMMSSGVISAPNGQGVVTENPGSQSGNGDNGNDDSNSFLPGYTPADDQTGVLGPQWQLGNSNPNDKIWFNFKTKTPTGAQGYAIDFAFFSSEWPVYVNTSFNDLFVAWEVSENFVGTISRIGDLPTTITALHPHWTDVPPNFPKTCANYGTSGPGFSCNEPQLQGTGFEGHAGTTWVRINQPVEQNADLEVFFFLADMADSILATGVLLDRFRFNCEECIPAEDPLCMGEIPDPNCCGVVLPM